MSFKNMMSSRILGRLKLYTKNGSSQFRQNSKFVSVTVNDKTGIATLSLQRPPVNSLNLELLTEISSIVTDLEKNKSRGMIMTSKKDGVFCAGLDFMEIYKPEKEKLQYFWTTLQDIWIKLYGSSFPTLALINGHAPAGGCLLTLCCEYRIMYRNYSIGLNETQVGLANPVWFVNSMRNVIGHRQTEKALTAGKLFSTEEAFNIGLIDDIIENQEKIEKVEAFFKKFANISPAARARTKQLIRAETVENLIKHRNEDCSAFVMFATQPSVQEYLGAYLEKLKQKSSES